MLNPQLQEALEGIKKAVQGEREILFDIITDEIKHSSGGYRDG
jgi:hypothetical protein